MRRPRRAGDRGHPWAEPESAWHARAPHLRLDHPARDRRRPRSSHGAELGVTVETFQSNHEGLLIDRVQQAHGKAAGLIVNAGGLTHTSVSLRDAIAAIKVPTVEVHLSNLYTREQNSAIAPIWPRSVWGRLQGWARSGTVWRSTRWPGWCRASGSGPGGRPKVI
jgi:3-dehydroquinate dehydratase